MSENLSVEQKERLLELFKIKEESERYNKLEYYFPDTDNFNYSQEATRQIFSRDKYPKHMQFFRAGRTYPQRIFSAGNRVGKSTSGCYELALHLTGLYKPWWPGLKFSRPIVAWAAGFKKDKVQESIVKILLGSKEDIGSGLIPKRCIKKVVSLQGSSSGIYKVYIEHISGRLSELTFKSYEEGAEGFVASAIDFILLDEEPSLKIYTESVMRTITTHGNVVLTFTPDRNITETVMHFFPDGEFVEGGRDGKHVTFCSVDDVPHLDDEQKARMWAETQPVFRSAKLKGIPTSGTGLVYPLQESDMIEKPFELPTYWEKGFGLDVGVRLTAAVFGAFDPTNKVLHIYDEYSGEQLSATDNALKLKIKTKGWIAGIIDKASLRSNESDLAVVYDKYLEYGVNVYPSYSSPKVEVGIQQVYDMFCSGKLKIWTTCQKTISQLRLYCRDEKNNLKGLHDHLDALRYLVQGMNLVLSKNPENSDTTSNGTFSYLDQNAKRSNITGT